MPGNLATGGYGPATKVFHWRIFLLLAVQYAIGSIMPHIGRNTLDESWVHWHLLVGAAIFAVIVARFAWRLLHPVAMADGLTGGKFARLGRQSSRCRYRAALVPKGFGLGS